MPSLIPQLLLLCLGVHRLVLAAERPSARERFRVVIAPLICRRTCLKGHCQDTCEQGNNTTLVGENGQSADTLTGPGFRVVVCPLTCMNGGQCSSRSHCLCPPGFTGRLCQFSLRQGGQGGQGAVSAGGGEQGPVGKQTLYTLQVLPETQSLGDQPGPDRQRQPALSTFTLPLTPGGGHHSSEVQVNVRVHHTSDTSVIVSPIDQSETKPPHKPPTRLPPQTHKPRGRCFQETTPKQACSSNPLPGLTNQEDCCGSVGNSWGQNKCHKCPKLHYTGAQKTGSIIGEIGSSCPQGYKRLNTTHCQDINECTMQGVCQNGDCLNTQGSFLCACKPGYVLERMRCVDSPGETGPCYRMVTEQDQCEHALPTQLSQEMCCCTVGKAWGQGCERCPQVGTASFSKICPAGKGYIFQSFRQTLSFPQHVFPDEKKGVKPMVPRREEPEVTTPAQPPTTTAPSPRYPVLRPTPPTIEKVPPETDINSPMEMSTQMAQTDACRQNRNICGHGECSNTFNGFICHCYTGYRFNPQKKYCMDENECEKEPCGPGRGLCINTVGSYTCRCNHGYKLGSHNRMRTCVDVNECAKDNSCGESGRCVNLPGGYRCDCYEGFKSKSPRHPACEDIDECLDRNTCPNAQCENTPGSYECLPCPAGHRAQAGTCYDINECQKRGMCQYGHCENLVGTYRCLCHEGFAPESDSKGCRDIDECLDERLCANGKCNNTLGSFKCLCHPGFQLTHEGSHCEDTNECDYAINCQGGDCINTHGSFQCECGKGFKLENNICKDINECALDRRLCQPHGFCENRKGSYVCVCHKGYRPSEDHHSCEEIEVDHDDKRECYLDMDDTVFCDSVLATNITKQECCCSIGVGWGDHCEIYPCPVHNSAEFHSLCPTGKGFYHEERVTTYGLPMHRDIDECVLFANEICKEGRCMNTQPGYECYCQQGFYYDGNLLECIDVDECHDNSLCANGRCVNTRGAYYCNCNPPWISDVSGKKCVMPDVDECQDPANCKNGRCVNTQGSYYCICTLPWTLATDRNSCIPPEEQGDVNECQDPSYCKNGVCINTPGSYHCLCSQPFTFSAALKQCVYDDRTAAHKDVCFQRVDEGLICSGPRSQLVTYSTCCCHFGNGWGPECRTCPERNSDVFNRLCEMHVDTESDGESEFLPVYVDHNPTDSSEEDSDECTCVNGHCERAYLSLTCKCNQGYRLDQSRTRCIDIDECTEVITRLMPCKNAHCVNTPGSYKCFCKSGFLPTRLPNICLRPRSM
ncbi:latent-transforming growth factor beta-binding protein 3 isoform X2 [Amia ocellicauda]|uniref:latent-transforming growth factor beta-binding protein 3 isoform X2 n=1 Tax=Amia ocellicauda TaxID=2972642 RepID=UPI0034640F2F